MLEKLKKLNEKLENMSDEEIYEMVMDIEPEDAEQYAELERFIMGDSDEEES